MIGDYYIYIDYRHKEGYFAILHPFLCRVLGTTLTLTFQSKDLNIHARRVVDD